MNDAETMVINVFLSHKKDKFIIIDFFNLNYKNLIPLCLYINAFRHWSISRFDTFFTLLPNVFDVLLDSIYERSAKIKHQIFSEKGLIKNNKDFWKVYQIEVDIFYEAKNEAINSKLFNLMIFLFKYFVRCPDIKIRKTFSLIED